MENIETQISQEFSCSTCGKKEQKWQDSHRTPGIEASIFENVYTKDEEQTNEKRIGESEGN